ncbi:unnamed protein product [Ilex paraguariensis]|uniref:Uncharacterized protein n=1 Tax=Ilex paraguariensis TaxID=185542 RepID=A0ABC8V095_9AQUA
MGSSLGTLGSTSSKLGLTVIYACGELGAGLGLGDAYVGLGLGDTRQLGTDLGDDRQISTSLGDATHYGSMIVGAQLGDEVSPCEIQDGATACNYQDSTNFHDKALDGVWGCETRLGNVVSEPGGQGDALSFARRWE